MNEEVVTAVAGVLAVCRLENTPSKATLAVARNVIRALQVEGFTITSRNERNLERTTQ